MKKISLLFLTLASVSFADAQFDDRQYISAPFYTPTDVLCKDLDLDGDLDIISSSKTTGEIVWIENYGAGEFNVLKTVSDEIETPTHFVVEDLDLDGDQDIIAASFNEGTIVWFENSGEQVFSEAQIIIDDLSGASGLAVADVDEDGDMDVVTAAKWTSKITLHKNNGSQNFETFFTISATANVPQDVYIEDMDNDGDLDVISTSENDHEVAWYKNVGGGGFDGERQLISSGIGPGTFNFSDLSDIDGDGDLDVVTFGIFNHLVWHENDGTGSFGEEMPVTDIGSSNSNVFTIDLDGDGDQDVVAAPTLGSDIVWFENSGLGVFETEQLISTELNGPKSIYAGDFDGDGNIDVVSASEDYSDIRLFKNDGLTESFEAHNIAKPIGLPSFFTSADIDGDLQVDVLLGKGYEGIIWFKNVEFGKGFVRRVLLAEESTIIEASTFAFADFDGDDKVDVITGFFNTDEVAWHSGDGLGNYGEQNMIISSSDSPHEVLAVDVDLDGDMDFIMAYSGDYKIAWYANDGLGNFGAEQVILDEYGVGQNIELADVNGDGYMDVVSMDISEDEIIWFKNEGGDSFGGKNTIASGIEEYSSMLRCADLDNDGNVDILFGTYDTDEILWYKNDGDGGFDAGHIIDSEVDFAAYSQGLNFSDLDLDGDLDVIGAPTITENVLWYENDGTGTFGSAQFIGEENTGILINTGDLSGNAYPDVIVLSWESGEERITWYENYSGSLGQPEFSPQYSNIEIFPNPFNDFVTIRFESDESINAEFKVVVFNELGEKVYENNGVKNNSLTLTKAELGTGILLLSVTNKGTGEISTSKLIIY